MEYDRNGMGFKNAIFRQSSIFGANVRVTAVFLFQHTIFYDKLVVNNTGENYYSSTIICN
jgi:hypothetical protein